MKGIDKFEFRNEQIDLTYHINKVYQLVIQTLLFYTIGSIIGVLLVEYIMNIYVTAMHCIGTFVFLFMFIFASNDTEKWYIMNCMGVTLGIISGPLLTFANIIDPIIIPCAATGTLVILITFSVASHYIKDEYMMTIGGFLGASLNILMLYGLVTLFFGQIISDTSDLIITICGLLVFCIYVAYDTKIMCDKFRSGKFNYYEHAMFLFLDIVNVFVHLVEIMIKLKLKNKKNKKDKSKTDAKKKE